jgi:oxygen-dependent protoporphyrinogen oxidase
MPKPHMTVIGGGISGLSAGFFVREKFGEEIELSIHEKSRRLGGTIGTTRTDGYMVDWGSNGFLDREPLTLEFIDKIGLKNSIYPANKKANKRFICRNDRLWEISPHPLKFMTSGLLSLKGRLRVGMEYFVSQRKETGDESIFDFAARRIGREAAEILIDPMVSGIFGGDAAMLSLGACFPIMAQMEREHGGLIKALLKKKKEKSANQDGGPAGPSGHLTSFRGGLYTLIERLEEILKPHIRYSSNLEKIHKTETNQLHLKFADHEIESDYLILAVPAYNAAAILKDLSPETAAELNNIPYSSLAVVCQGYNNNNIGRIMDGFGFLVPHNQNKNILGSIWTSIIFPEQAPGGQTLFRTMLGGAKNKEVVEKSEMELSQITFEELSQLLDIKAKPIFNRVFIWRDAIPQYVIGHRQRLDKIEHHIDNLRNIGLAGNAYTGIGLNDCIKRSHNVVSNMLLP